MVQQFTEAFVQALQIPDGPTADSGFKMEVLKVNPCWGTGHQGTTDVIGLLPCHSASRLLR